MKNKYEVHIQEKGVNEIAGQELEDDKVFYTVKLEDGVGYDTTSQFEAEILSRLVELKRDNNNNLLLIIIVFISILCIGILYLLR